MSLLTVAPVVLAAAIGAAMLIKEQEGILQARAFDYAQHDRHHRPRIAMALETIAGTPAAKNADIAGLYEIGKHASEFLHARGFVVRDPTGHELNHRVKQEQGGAVREGASEKGFGSALITTSVEKDLNGMMETGWARTAFACASNCRRTRCSPCRPQQVWPCLKRNTKPA